MDGSSVIFIVIPIVIPLVLFAGIAPPYLADSRLRRKHRDMHTTLAARQGSGPVRPRVLIVGGRRSLWCSGRDWESGHLAAASQVMGARG